MSEVLPAVEPTDPFEIQLIQENPEDATRIQTLKNQIADIHAKRSYEKEAHDMIFRIISFIKDGNISFKHYYKKALWAGMFIIPNMRERICWINRARLEQVTGFTKSSIRRYLKKIKFVVSEDQVKSQDALVRMLNQCKMTNQRRAWVKYDANEVTDLIIQYANDYRAYLDGTQDQNAAVLIQPAPIMTIRHNDEIVGVATPKQRENQLRCFVNRVEHRVKEEKAIEEIQAEIDAGVAGYDKVEYRIKKDVAEGALLDDLKQQIESSQDDQSKMQALMDYMFIYTYNVRDMRQLFCGCIHGRSNSGINFFWFDLQRMHELTGVNIRTIQQFWTNNHVSPSKAVSATTEERNDAIKEDGLQDREFELYRDMKSRGY